MKRKIGTAVVGLSVLGFGIFGFTHGNGGGIVQAASVGDGGGAPSYTHGEDGLRVMHMDIQEEHQFMDMETIQHLLLM